MKKFIATVFSAMLFASSASAASQQFYSVDVRPGPYYVYGVTANVEQNENPACYAEVNWRDGSRLQIIRDLADSELYIFFRNVSWNIIDAPGVYQLRANFHKNGQINGLNFAYNLINKNTIVIRNIKKEAFLPLFTDNQRMIFVMPGAIANAEVDLTGSSRALAEISKCIDAARSVELYPDGPAQSNSTGPRPRGFDNI